MKKVFHSYKEFLDYFFPKYSKEYFKKKGEKLPLTFTPEVEDGS